MNNEAEIKELICEVGRRLYDRNLIAATDGNISVRLESDRFLCTRSGVSKGFMSSGDIVVADAAGNKIEGDGKVSSEFFTHLAAYEERPDVQAVVHAHPPTAVGLTLAGVSMTDPVLPELVGSLGGISTADYATPGTPEGADVIREHIRECDAVLLDRHGAVTIGPDLLDAYLKMEKVEHSAETIFVARQLGDPSVLDDDQIARIYQAREAYGAKGKLYKPER